MLLECDRWESITSCPTLPMATDWNQNAKYRFYSSGVKNTKINNYDLFWCLMAWSKKKKKGFHICIFTVYCCRAPGNQKLQPEKSSLYFHEKYSSSDLSSVVTDALGVWCFLLEGPITESHTDQYPAQTTHFRNKYQEKYQNFKSINQCSGEGLNCSACLYQSGGFRSDLLWRLWKCF